MLTWLQTAKQKTQTNKQNTLSFQHREAGRGVMQVSRQGGIEFINILGMRKASSLPGTAFTYIALGDGLAEEPENHKQFWRVNSRFGGKHSMCSLSCFYASDFQILVY